ncbi:sugar phosphate nucleotidyltransferase [Streptomyces sp. NPDC005209]|uniref:nucleotidyltransferase family protein n=1 Tax=Streptomyces sp. NPDC005209 TaxID=3156715 RepID=UPI0033B40379
MHAIVIAGGKGTRLGPLTAKSPKALMRFGDRSLLEITLLQMRRAGATRITLCVSHLSHLIEREFGNGQRLGLRIDYCHDPGRLGTAGPLRHVSDWNSPALVVNCDILTSLDFGRLHRAHCESGRVLTIATKRRDITVPFGVLEVTDQGAVQSISEKPTLSFDVSAGIYVVNAEVRSRISADGPMDMPLLVQTLLENGSSVGASPFTARWHDIGTPDSYQTAQNEYLADPRAFLAPEYVAAMAER